MDVCDRLYCCFGNLLFHENDCHHQLGIVFYAIVLTSTSIRIAMCEEQFYLFFNLCIWLWRKSSETENLQQFICQVSFKITKQATFSYMKLNLYKDSCGTEIFASCNSFTYCGKKFITFHCLTKHNTSHPLWNEN